MTTVHDIEQFALRAARRIDTGFNLFDVVDLSLDAPLARTDAEARKRAAAREYQRAFNECFLPVVRRFGILR